MIFSNEAANPKRPLPVALSLRGSELHIKSESDYWKAVDAIETQRDINKEAGL